MSDSSMALKPVIEEPSKPIPPSRASSSSSLVIAKLLSCPRMSVNQSRMNFTSRSSTAAMTSSRVIPRLPLGSGADLRRSLPERGRARPPRARGRRARLRPARATRLLDEEDLGVFRERPQVVRDGALEDVPDAPHLRHGGEHGVAHVHGLLHEALGVADVR